MDYGLDLSLHEIQDCHSVKLTKVDRLPAPAFTDLKSSRDLMADLSKLSIAPYHHDLLLPQSKSNRTETQDITSNFFIAASGPCSPQQG